MHFAKRNSVPAAFPAVNQLTATYYPTELRSTGIGWSLGIGRIGSVIGPVLGGYLMHLQWTQSQLFIAAAVPALVSLLGIIAIRYSAGFLARSRQVAGAELSH